MTWGVGKITLALYPFGWGAMAVNTFFASLIGSWVGLPVLTTLQSVVVGGVIGLPLTWLFARHIRHLMRQAEGNDS